MSTITKEEFLILFQTDKLAFVKAFIDEAGYDPERAKTYASNFHWRSVAKQINVHGFGVEVVQSDGGGEGEGENVDWVFEIACGDLAVYFNITGFYTSEEGVEWDDDITIVEPREVVVTQYFAV